LNTFGEIIPISLEERRIQTEEENRGEEITSTSSFFGSGI
jgi:hypothetical protein